jgi:protein-disulfide isomerase
MSSDDSSNDPAPRDRREAVREKAQQVQAKQSRARIIRITALSLSAVIVVGAIAGGVYWAFSSFGSRQQLQPDASGDGFPVTEVAGIPGAQAESGVDGSSPTAAPQAAPSPTSTSSTTVAIDVYVDYLSPGAKEFQLANAQQLQTWVEQKSVELSYFPVAMLTAKSNGTKYSLRAASAAACVATYAPDAFFRYNYTLLTEQPDQDAAGPSDQELAVTARASGAGNAKQVQSCIEEEKFVGWVKSATDRALEGIPGTNGVTLTGTPLILVNGIPYVGDLNNPKEFSQFVLTVSSDAYYATPAPTASPTPTATP